MIQSGRLHVCKQVDIISIENIIVTDGIMTLQAPPRHGELHYTLVCDCQFRRFTSKLS